MGGISEIGGIFSGMASIGEIYASKVVIIKYPYSFSTDQENIGMDMWKAIEAYNCEEEIEPPKIAQSTITATTKTETRKSA